MTWITNWGQFLRVKLSCLHQKAREFWGLAQLRNILAAKLENNDIIFSGFIACRYKQTQATPFYGSKDFYDLGHNQNNTVSEYCLLTILTQLTTS